MTNHEEFIQAMAIKFDMKIEKIIMNPFTYAAIFGDPHGITKNVTDCMQRAIQRNAYEALKQQLEERSAMEFKIGDKVKIIDAPDYLRNRNGQMGRVIEIDESSDLRYLVKFDDIYLWFREKHLQYVKSKFEMGDRVKIVNSEGYLLLSDSCGVISTKGKLCGYYILLDDLNFPLWFVNESSLEKLEDTPEPKIVAVVKYIVDVDDGITKDKFYPVGHIEKSGMIRFLDNDNLIRYRDPKDEAILFKVGDRFIDPTRRLLTIIGFAHKADKDCILWVDYKYDDGIQSSWNIKSFDTYLAKIEDEPVKQEDIKVTPDQEFTVTLPKDAHKIKLDVEDKIVKYELKQEYKLKVGDIVRILKDATFQGDSVVLVHGVKSAIGCIGVIEQIIPGAPEGDFFVTGLPMECKGWWYRKESLLVEPLEFVKQEPKPKFQIGQMVENVSTHEKGEISTVTKADHTNTGSVLSNFVYDLILEKRKYGNRCMGNVAENNLKLIEEPELKVDKRKLLSSGTKIKIIQCLNPFNSPEKLGKIGVITYVEKDTYGGDYVYKVDIDGIYTWCAYNEVEKLETTKLEWVPKFKVGDWVYYLNAGSNSDALFQILEIVYKDKSYRVTLPQGRVSGFAYNDDNLELWQPMQALKEVIRKQECDFELELIHWDAFGCKRDGSVPSVSREIAKSRKIATVKELFAKHSLCSLEGVLAAIEREYK